MIVERLSPDNDPMAEAIANDPNFRYWIYILRNASMEPDEAVEFADNLWRATATDHEVDLEDASLKEAAFTRATMAVEEERRAQHAL